MITKSTLSLMISVIRSTSNGMQHSVDTTVFPGNAALAVVAGAVPEQQLDYFVTCLNGASDLIAMRVPVENWNYYVGNSAESFYHYGLRYVAPAMYAQRQSGFNATEPKPFHNHHHQGCGISSTPQHSSFGWEPFEKPEKSDGEQTLGDILREIKNYTYQTSKPNNYQQSQAFKEIIDVDRILSDKMWYTPFFNELLSPSLSGLKPINIDELVVNLRMLNSTTTVANIMNVDAGRIIATLMTDLTSAKGFPVVMDFEGISPLYAKLNQILPEDYKQVLSINIIRIAQRYSVIRSGADNRRLEIYDAIAYGCLMNNSGCSLLWEKALSNQLPMSFIDFAKRLSDAYIQNAPDFMDNYVNPVDYRELKTINGNNIHPPRVYKNLNEISNWHALTTIAGLIINPLLAIESSCLSSKMNHTDNKLYRFINQLLRGEITVTATTNDQELVDFVTKETKLNQLNFLPVENSAAIIGELFKLFGYGRPITECDENVANGARCLNSNVFCKFLDDLYSPAEDAVEYLQDIEIEYLKKALCATGDFTLINSDNFTHDRVTKFLQVNGIDLNDGFLTAAIADVMNARN